MSCSPGRKLFPGPKGHTKWCAFVRLRQCNIEALVQDNELGSSDDELGLADVEEQAARLQQILASPSTTTSCAHELPILIVAEIAEPTQHFEILQRMEMVNLSGSPSSMVRQT